MSEKSQVYIACGGTGGHLFPGLAVAQQLIRRNCAITLIVSEKDVDDQALQNVWDMDTVTLPAVGFDGKNHFKFASASYKAYRLAKKMFKDRPPEAVLAMGGFTSGPPIMAARSMKALTYLHESNAIPGRANRWLAYAVTRVFIGFGHAESQFHGCEISDIGTPVRPQFTPRDASQARTALGLDPARPVLLIMGGSQGATAINELLIKSLPHFLEQFPELQYIHLTGVNDEDRVRQAYGEKMRGGYIVKAFHAEMEIALAAATVAISRAGSSSLAELAAMRVPPVLIPYPAATDNHQLHNAREYEKTGAAKVIEQAEATPELLSQAINALAKNAKTRESVFLALGCWHRPRAADAIAEQIANAIRDKTAGK